MVPPGYTFSHYPATQAAHNPSIVSAVANIFSNSFGTNPKTGDPYRLGPNKTRERLQGTDDLVIALDSAGGYVAYVYARRIDTPQGMVVWIDSLAVLPAHRRKGLGTTVVRSLIESHSVCRWVGCATPNPVAALVITRASDGVAYAGECSPPNELIEMIQNIRGQTPDLQGADFNTARLLVRTSFNPTISGDRKDWSPPHPSEPPPWWSSLSNLPYEHEALLIIDRQL